MGYKLTRMRNKMLGNSLLGSVFQMNLVYHQLAKRLILSREMKRVGEQARSEFRDVRGSGPLSFHPRWPR